MQENAGAADTYPVQVFQRAGVHGGLEEPAKMGWAHLAQICQFLDLQRQHIVFINMGNGRHNGKIKVGRLERVRFVLRIFADQLDKKAEAQPANTVLIIIFFQAHFFQDVFYKHMDERILAFFNNVVQPKGLEQEKFMMGKTAWKKIRQYPFRINVEIFPPASRTLGTCRAVNGILINNGYVSCGKIKLLIFYEKISAAFIAVTDFQAIMKMKKRNIVIRKHPSAAKQCKNRKIHREIIITVLQSIGQVCLWFHGKILSCGERKLVSAEKV